MGRAGAARPVFLVVDDERDAVAALARALNRRLRADYQIITECSPERGLSVLKLLRERGRQVAVVIADVWLPGMTGVEFLVRAHQLHPAAQRAVLLDSFDRSARESIVQAMTLGWADTWLVKPWEPADHWLYPRVGELLDEWVLATEQPGTTALRVVADAQAPRTHELRDVLDRNTVPVEFLMPESPESRRLLGRVGQESARLPVVEYFDGRVQVDPSDTDIAAALGVSVRPEADEYDFAVVGASPAGLSAAVCGASEGLRILLLEPRTIGGQASSTSMIRNYLGFPCGVRGQQLTRLAADQAFMFGATLVFDRATRLHADGTRRVLTLASGARVGSDAVMISVGVDYRRLTAPGVEEMVGAGVFYGAAVCEAPSVRGQPVYVAGGGNSAGQAAVHFAKYAAHVTILVRGPSLADTMSDYLIKQINANPTISVRFNTQITSAEGAGRLERLTLHDAATGHTEDVASSALFILIGARPHTDWLSDTLTRDADGFVLTGPDLCPDEGSLPACWPLGRPPLHMETSIPGVFAAGDVRHGSVKRVATAVGEGANATQLVHRYLGALGSAA